jgi:uncharacterized membrane protein YesL
MLASSFELSALNFVKIAFIHEFVHLHGDDLIFGIGKFIVGVGQ